MKDKDFEMMMENATRPRNTRSTCWQQTTEQSEQVKSWTGDTESYCDFTWWSHSICNPIISFDPANGKDWKITTLKGWR